MRRDAGCVAILLLVALTPLLRDVEQASRPGLFARVAINRETINRGAFFDGTLPLWNPYEFGGVPHLANPNTLTLYPPHIVLRALPLPIFFAISFALHTWLAGAGAYVAARVLGASRLISMLAGGAMMGGRLLLPFDARAQSLDVYAVAWLPLIAALSLRSAESTRWLPHPGLVMAASFALLAAALNPTYVLATVTLSYLFSAIWFDRGAGRTPRPPSEDQGEGFEGTVPGRTDPFNPAARILAYPLSLVLVTPFRFLITRKGAGMVLYQICQIFTILSNIYQGGIPHDRSQGSKSPTGKLGEG